MSYELELVLNRLETEEFLERAKAVSKVYRREIPDLLNEAIITLIAKTAKPRLKDYITYLEGGRRIKGISVRYRMKGKKAWKDGTHGIESNLNKIIESYELKDINEDLLDFAYELIDRTLKSIFEGDNKKLRESFDIALSSPHFLHMLLQISVRLLGEKLRENDVELKNRTLDYILDRIQKDRKEIVKLFVEAQTEAEKRYAIKVYYNELEKYFIDFMERELNGLKGEDVKTIGKELALVDHLGEDLIYIAIGAIMGQIQDFYRINIPLIEEDDDLY